MLVASDTVFALKCFRRHMLLEICSKCEILLKCCPKSEKVLKGAQNAKQCSKLKQVLKRRSAQSGKAQSRRADRAGFESPNIFFFLLSFFPFFVLLFSINIQLNNCCCYLIKCNKQQEKFRVSREKIVHRTIFLLNIWINNLNFYNFLQFTVVKPELITT